MGLEVVGVARRGSESLRILEIRYLDTTSIKVSLLIRSHCFNISEYVFFRAFMDQSRPKSRDFCSVNWIPT